MYRLLNRSVPGTRQRRLHTRPLFREKIKEIAENRWHVSTFIPFLFFFLINVDFVVFVPAHIIPSVIL